MTDTELWRLRDNKRDMVCTIREVRDPARGAWESALLGFELRTEKNGEIYLTELHPRRKALDARSRQLHDALVEKGWRNVDA